MSFYYFVASLPTLSLAGSPPLALEAFLSDARRLLSAATADELDALVGDDPTRATSAFAAQWREAEAQLRNASAKVRAAKLDVDPAVYQKPGVEFNSHAERAVAEAFAKSNPLEREMALDRHRWTLLEEWVRSAQFSEDAVLAYGLKLKMAHRWARLSDEAGRTKLTEAVERVRGTVAA